MNAPAVFIDACVLASAMRRHLLLSFAEAELIYPRWSEKVLFETGHAHARIVGDKGRDGAGEAARLVTALQAAYPEASVPEDAWRGIEIAGPLPDRDDAHVIQAAKAGGAGFILTENLKDFPRKTLNPLGLYARATADFLGSALRADPDSVQNAFDHTAQRLNFTPAQFDLALARSRLGALVKAMGR